MRLFDFPALRQRLLPFLARPEWIYFDQRSKSARAAFDLEGLSAVEQPDRAAMLWMRKGYRQMMDALQPHQLINHIPNERCIINKVRLTRTLQRHESNRTEGCLPLSSFYQETWRLDDPKQRAMFFSQLPEPDDPENLWIYKPGASSRGRGIRILWQFDEFREEYKSYGDHRITDRKRQGIVQRYIHNPLLLKGRKSEIRVYWLVANLDPLMVLLYPEATVRLNTLPYQLGDFDNPLVHVTNVYQQKNHPDHDPDAVLKWKFEALGRYLSEELGLVDADFLQQILVPQIRRVLATVARAAKPSLLNRLPEQGHCFAVYGADFILDDQLTPWLSEVQKGPGLSFNDPVKRDVIVPMLGEAARIMLEIRRRHTRGLPLKDLSHVDQYRWVINDLQPELVE